jgi:hypothetical protein
MPKPSDARDKDPHLSADHRPDAGVPSAEMRPRLQPGPTARLMDMLRLRFDAVARQKFPHQLSSLVEKIRAHPGFAATGKQHMPQASEQQQAEPMQQRSFVICAICLGTGQRAGANLHNPQPFAHSAGGVVSSTPRRERFYDPAASLGSLGSRRPLKSSPCQKGRKPGNATGLASCQ